MNENKERRCPECGETMEWDNVTHEYYCPNCGHTEKQH